MVRALTGGHSTWTKINVEQKMRKSIIVGIAAATTVVSVAFAQMMPTKTGDSTKGKVLTNDAGMTLCVFDKDSGGKSACNGACAGNWPPLMAAAGAMPMNDYTVIAREDGAKSVRRTGQDSVGLSTQQGRFASMARYFPLCSA